MPSGQRAQVEERRNTALVRCSVIVASSSGCSVWNLCELRRELVAEVRGIVQQQLL
jgi:hypothetical protein